MRPNPPSASNYKSVDNVDTSKIRPGKPIKADDIRAALDKAKRPSIGRGAGFDGQDITGHVAKTIGVGKWIQALSLDDAPPNSVLSIAGSQFQCGQALLIVKLIDTRLTRTAASMVLTNGHNSLNQNQFGWVRFMLRGPEPVRANDGQGAPHGRIRPKL